MVADSLESASVKLSSKIAIQIAEYIRDNNLSDGGSVSETSLAEILHVSRSPVRAALEQLASLKILEPSGPRRGFRVVASAAEIDELTDAHQDADEEEALYLAIASDYMEKRIRDQFNEADIIRQYNVGRKLMRRVLQRMANDRVIDRNAGYGWNFAPLLRSIESHDDSYRFRLLLEPSGFLQPGFALDKPWAARSRREMENILSMQPETVSMVQFFEMNSSFHELLAASSGNHFLHQAIQMQNQVRRFVDYRWTAGLDRIHASCREHLEILDAAESGDTEWASALMRRHLEISSRIKP